MFPPTTRLLGTLKRVLVSYSSLKRLLLLCLGKTDLHVIIQQVFINIFYGFPGDPGVKNSPASAGDMGLIPGLD